MQDWILGQPVQTDNTDFEWVLGTPYIIYEITTGGLSIPVAMSNYLRQMGA